MRRDFQAPSSGNLRSSGGEYDLPAFMRFAIFASLLLMPAFATQSKGQPQSGLIETGHVLAAGKQVTYRLRFLPVNAFPDLPRPVVNALTARGCLIPQTYGAHGPENVIHGSFEREGATDWAVLCSSEGTVSLLVFLASGSASEPVVLDSAPSTSRLQPDDAGGDLGFAWGIDPATPKQVHDGQAGSSKRPVTPNHDCIAESVIDRAPLYRCLQSGKWAALDSQ